MAKQGKKHSTYKQKTQQHIPRLHPLTRKQEALIHAIEGNQMVVTTGSPGTGKTYVPASLAARAYLREDIDYIILTRPNVSQSKSLGFRPGDMIEKAWEWFAEVLSVLEKWLQPGGLYTAMKKGNIQIVPFETMRGRSFNNGFVFLDEAQNTTVDEMKMFVTRIGDANVVLNGDINQSDIGANSGLRRALDIIRACGMDVPVIEFDHEDIVRSELCKQWIVNWEDYHAR